jgi:hypothetical protein
MENFCFLEYRDNSIYPPVDFGEIVFAGVDIILAIKKSYVCNDLQ